MASTSHWAAVFVVVLVVALGPGLTTKLEIGVFAVLQDMVAVWLSDVDVHCGPVDVVDRSGKLSAW